MTHTIKITNIIDNEVHFDEYDQDGHFTISDYWTLDQFNQILINNTRVIDMDAQDFLALARKLRLMTKSYGSYSITAFDPANGYTYSLAFETPQGKRLDTPCFWSSSATKAQLNG